MKETFSDSLIEAKQNCEMLHRLSLAVGHKVDWYHKSYDMGPPSRGLKFKYGLFKEMRWSTRGEKKGSIYVDNNQELVLARKFGAALEDAGFVVNIVKNWLPQTVVDGERKE